MKQEFFIIGAGVAGLSVANALVSHGRSVTLADASHPGQSSWAGAGIVFPLLPWHYGEAMSRLALAGMRAWPQWAAQLHAISQMDTEFHVSGMEILDPDAGATALAYAWCAAHDIPLRILESGHLWLPDVAQVRNPRLIAALAAAVSNQGGQYIANCRIDGSRIRGRTLEGVSCGDAVYTAEQFVLAAGAWSGQAIPGISPVPNIQPIRGQMLLYPPGSHRLHHIVYQHGVYLVPRKDGHLLVGSTLENAGFDVCTTEEALTRLSAAASELVPELRGLAPVRSWSGLRPGSPDNIPVIGRHPDFDNVWIHAGHYRYGVTMAPASSQLLVEMMLGMTPHLDPTPYSWQATESRQWNDAPC